MSDFDSLVSQLNPSSDFDSLVSQLGTPAPAAKEPGLGDRLKAGLKSTINAGEINLTDDNAKIAKLVQESQANALPPTKAQQEMAAEIQPYVERANNAEGFLENAKEGGKLALVRAGQLLTNPKESLGMIVENLPNSAPGLAGMLAGGAAGSPAGPVGAGAGSILGGFAGGYSIEQGSAMREQILKEAKAKGVDVNDTEALTKLIGENYQDLLDKSRAKGAGTAGVDAVLNRLTFGVAGAFERGLAKAADATRAGVLAGEISAKEGAAQLASLEAKLAAHNTLPAKALRGAGVTGAEMGSESLSEAAGQKLAYGKVDMGEVVDEGLLALGQGGLMAAGRKAISPIIGAGEKGGPEAAIGALKDAIQKPATTQAGLEQDLATANSAIDQYQAGEAPNAGLLTHDPNVAITVNPVTRNIVEIDRRTGPLSDAAADAVDSGLEVNARSTDAGNLLFAHPSSGSAQNAIEAKDDPELYKVVPHPRVDGRFAVVPKTGAELQAVMSNRQAKAANQKNAQTQEALSQEESDVTQSGQVATKTPEATRQKAVPAPAEAKDLTAAAAAQDISQTELAPNQAQPVSEMPGTLQRNAKLASQANASQQARASQVVDEEAHGANTAPTEAQQQAGNYRKGHIKVSGLDISVENPAGSSRSGIENGKKWKTKMSAHYGYIKRSKGADGEQVDVYVRPGLQSNHEGDVFVVDQYNPAGGKFDEHKVLIGYKSQAQAAEAYDAHFSDKSGPRRRGAVTKMTMAQFKDWLANGDGTRAVAGKRFGKPAASEDQAAQDEIAQSTGQDFSRSRRQGETADQHQARMAEESNRRKKTRATEQKADSKREDDLGVVRESLAAGGFSSDGAELVDPRDLPGATETQGISKQSAGFVKTVARMFGKRVVFFEANNGNPDGFYTRGNTIYVNAASSVAELRVLGHEMLHALRKQAGDVYTNLVEAVSGVLTDEQLAAQHQDYFGEALDDLAMLDQPYDGSRTLRDFLAEEWLADLSGNRFAETDFWADVFSQIEARHGSLARQIIAKIRMAVVSALKKLQSLVAGQAFGVDDRVGDHLEQIRKALAAGFAEYANRSKAGTLAQESQPGTAFSRGKDKTPGSDNGHKRTKSGEYVGAPVGMTPSKLGALRTRLEALAREGEPGRFWYEESSKAILQAAEGDMALAEKIAGLLAIYSPQATVSGNTTMGLKALYQWLAGAPIKARFEDQNTKAQAWMDGTMAEGQALQIKTGNFFKNLMRKIDENRYGYEQQGATIDMWMARVFGYGSKAISSEARYFFAERETKRLADKLGWEPQQVQAALWVSIKSRIEAIEDRAREFGKKKGWLYRKETKSGGKINISWPPYPEHREAYENHMLKLALAQDSDPAGLLKSSYNFGTALRERVGQISWEAMPGKTTGVLPGIFNAPLEQQVEYLTAIDQALRDENGQDLIAQKLGLPVLQTAFGPSAWQMNVGAGAQTEVAIATERDQGNKKISVSEPARSLLNLYAAIRGYVLAQEAVVWHYPIFDASKKNANGVQLDFGRDPTHDEVEQLYKAIHEVSGREDWAPAYVPGVGVRVLNFAEPSLDKKTKEWVYWDTAGNEHRSADREELMPLAKADGVTNPQFHKAVLDAANRLSVRSRFKTFQSDGEYIGNDWGTASAGEQYKEIINASDRNQSRRTGRSDLQGWVEGVLRPRTQRVNEEFAAKYGWGKPNFSTRRGSDATGDERDGGRADSASQEIPSYGRGREGGNSAQGFHYSGAERRVLDGRYYGTGARGREADRVRAASDPRIKERIYFYVDAGKGITPEQGVGSQVHTVQLNNLYDSTHDLTLQAKLPRGLSDDAWNDAFESAVLDAGYDGYLSDFGTQRAAVLLGRHTVPVKYLGSGSQRGEVSQAKQDSGPAAKFMADRLLPFGAVTGAQWKQIVAQRHPGLDASQLEDTKTYYKDQVAPLLQSAGGVTQFSRSRDLAQIFEGLGGRGMKRARAEAALQEHPLQSTIRYVQDNILDILSTLEDSGRVEINC